MGNFEIYRKTLRFSIMRLILTVAGIAIFIGLPLGTFFATSGMDGIVCGAATTIAFIVGIVVFVLIARYGGYLFTAARFSGWDIWSLAPFRP